MPATIKFVGEHANMASSDELASGINAANAVFSKHSVDPCLCAAAKAKLDKDELLTKDEALLSVIWEVADDKAFRAVTLNWLVRDLDIWLALDQPSLQGD